MSITLNVAPEDRFDCTNCGKCCIVPWAAVVNPPEAAIIRDLDCYQRLEREGYRPLEVVQDQLWLNRDGDYRCYFLAADRLCDIHREAGAHAKPATCRLYPFSLVNTPDGYFVSLYYTCPAVISGSGGSLDQHLPALSETMISAPEFFPPNQKLSGLSTLVQGKKIDWSSYLGFEGYLLGTVRSGPTLTDSILESAVACAHFAEHGVFEVCWENSVPNLALRELQLRMPSLVAHIVAEFEGDEDRPPQKSEDVLSGSFESRILGTRAEGLAGVRVRDLLLDQVLFRYVSAKIWGKALITGPSLLTRLLCLAMSIEVYLLYYREKTRLDGKLHFSIEVAEWTFDLLEASILEQDELYIPLVEQLESRLLETVRGV